MDFFLVVTRPFRGYLRGDVIESVQMIDDIMNSEFRAAVVRVSTSFQRGA